VRRSNLRCFFFDMRLRRFLMTEPMLTYVLTYSNVPATLPRESEAKENTRRDALPTN
jgi:hypothetical protein